MASYRLLIAPSAGKELERLPRPTKLRVVQRMQALAAIPRPPSCKKLSDDNRYRIRQGDYRILYLIDDKSLEVTVVKIAHRSQAYRD